MTSFYYIIVVLLIIGLVVWVCPSLILSFSHGGAGRLGGGLISHCQLTGVDECKL